MSAESGTAAGSVSNTVGSAEAHAGSGLDAASPPNRAEADGTKPDNKNDSKEGSGRVEISPPSGSSLSSTDGHGLGSDGGVKAGTSLLGEPLQPHSHASPRGMVLTRGEYKGLHIACGATWIHDSHGNCSLCIALLRKTDDSPLKLVVLDNEGKHAHICKARNPTLCDCAPGAHTLTASLIESKLAEFLNAKPPVHSKRSR